VMLRLVALALVLALGGAGAALADHQEPQKRITKADQARARAILVKRTDVGPGYLVQPGTAPEPHLDCAQSVSTADLTLTGDAEGTQFVRGTVIVGSSAQVYESVADASAAWRRGTSAAGIQCLKTYLRRGYEMQGLRLVSVAKLSFARIAQRTIAFRAVLTGTTPQGDVRVWIDFVVLSHSRAHAQIVVASALAPPVRAEEVRLSRLVAGRMARAMRGA
jgi:hypothetical protein